MHVPAATVVTVDPDTVHTVGVSELNDTAGPEDAEAGADAVRVTGTPTFASGGCVKVIFCGSFPAWTRNERATSGAAA